ncbi:Uracil-regulated protein 1 [Physocladia obscura]|uniref:Uracil-regulated protein 1 n=1 Tax=Physocladia obscura TaxID=109957 RepID=A0AAD5T029_9FUNG|nr:Uracil-regulated protein 1 [Physocladia obscura]
MSVPPPNDETKALLGQLLGLVSQLQTSQAELTKQVSEYQKRTNRALDSLQQRVAEVVLPIVTAESPTRPYRTFAYDKDREHNEDSDDVESSTESFKKRSASPLHSPNPKIVASSNNSAQQPIYTSRVVLTTYPGQAGITPIPLIWGHSNPHTRGPIVASRIPSSMKLRNAVGAHGGAYSIYRALAIAIRELDAAHTPNLHNTEPVCKIGPFPSWNDPECIVSLDPWGHVIMDVYKDELAKGIDIRPTIAITKAHMKLLEVEEAVRKGRLVVDGKIVVNDLGDLMVTKGAVEPVWFLPGIAKRFQVDETTLRRALFEDTGGMYPELITRPDLKVFLPPIGGLSIYIMGPPEYLSDPSKVLTLRVHDECNGSDVFGSDICTCRPYLIYGIEEAVKTAQNGGVGLIVYFRKEGRALGEVTKYLVYNARKRAEGGDTAKNYFLRTENIAGVKDMRFQATMPDVLHWLGIKKIDRMISMSNMKYDAIVGSGIPILERVPIPADMLPPDSQVEIDAKIASGYFSHSAAPADLSTTKGRTWDDINH